MTAQTPDTGVQIMTTSTVRITMPDNHDEHIPACLIVDADPRASAARAMVYLDAYNLLGWETARQLERNTVALLASRSRSASH